MGSSFPSRQTPRVCHVDRHKTFQYTGSWGRACGPSSGYSGNQEESSSAVSTGKALGRERRQILMARITGDDVGHNPRRDGRQENSVAKVTGGYIVAGSCGRSEDG